MVGCVDVWMDVWMYRYRRKDGGTAFRDCESVIGI